MGSLLMNGMFNLLALLLVCASLASVQGNHSWPWFKTDNADDCTHVDENNKAIQTETKPSHDDCGTDGDRSCFCAKIKEQWQHKCVTCHKNNPFTLRVEKSPCEDGKNPTCNGASPVCKDGSKVAKSGTPCDRGQGPPTCEDKNVKPLCTGNVEPKRRQHGRRRR